MTRRRRAGERRVRGAGDRSQRALISARVGGGAALFDTTHFFFCARL
jgi:hypothetical protein